MLKCSSPLKTVIDCCSLSVVAVIICPQEHITFLLPGFFIFTSCLGEAWCWGGGDASSHFAASRAVHLRTLSRQRPRLTLSSLSASQAPRAWLFCCGWWIPFVAWVRMRGTTIPFNLCGLKNYDTISFRYGGQSLVTHLVLSRPVFSGNSHAFLISAHKYKQITRNKDTNLLREQWVRSEIT